MAEQKKTGTITYGEWRLLAGEPHNLQLLQEDIEVVKQFAKEYRSGEAITATILKIGRIRFQEAIIELALKTLYGERWQVNLDRDS